MYRVYRPWGENLYFQDVPASSAESAIFDSLVNSDPDPYLGGWKVKGKVGRRKNVWARRLLFGFI